jgi:hypothetical protein
VFTEKNEPLKTTIKPEQSQPQPVEEVKEVPKIMNYGGFGGNKETKPDSAS